MKPDDTGEAKRQHAVEIKAPPQDADEESRRCGGQGEVATLDHLDERNPSKGRHVVEKPQPAVKEGVPDSVERLAPSRGE